jgi:hypothetical protein
MVAALKIWMTAHMEIVAHEIVHGIIMAWKNAVIMQFIIMV